MFGHVCFELCCEVHAAVSSSYVTRLVRHTPNMRVEHTVVCVAKLLAQLQIAEPPIALVQADGAHPAGENYSQLIHNLACLSKSQTFYD